MYMIRPLTYRRLANFFHFCWGDSRICQCYQWSGNEKKKNIISFLLVLYLSDKISFFFYLYSKYVKIVLLASCDIFFADSPLRNLENRMHQDLTIGAFANRILEGHRPFLCTLSRNVVGGWKNFVSFWLQFEFFKNRLPVGDSGREAVEAHRHPNENII